MQIKFRSFRYFTWLAKAYLNRFLPKIITGFVCGLLLFFLAAKTIPFFLKLLSPKIIRYGIVGNYTPTSLPLSIQNLLSLGLTQITSDGRAIPSVASGWNISDDGKIYTIYLNKNFEWSDGKNFTAHDVNYNLKDVTINIIDNYTLQLKLKEPFSPLPVFLAKPLFRKSLIGLNTYKVKRLILNGDKLKLLHLTSTLPKKLDILYHFYPNEEACILGFKLAEIDIIEGIGSINDLSSWSKIHIQEKNNFESFVGLFLNLKKSLFTDKSLRQGLAYAVPNTASYEKIGSPIPSSSWAFKSDVKVYKYNLEQAKKLLSDYTQATKSSEIVLSTFFDYLPLAQEIAKSWTSIGINTSVKVEYSVPYNFEVLLGSHEVPVDPDQYPLWHSTQATNITGFSNVKIDKLLEEGRKVTDEEERKKIYKDFQRYMAEEIPVIFLYHAKTYTVYRSKILNQ